MATEDSSFVLGGDDSAFGFPAADSAAFDFFVGDGLESSVFFLFFPLAGLVSNQQN
jgi:hypothetical protein